MIAVVLVMAVFALVWTLRAINLDRIDRDSEAAAIREYHIFHGPADGCPECVSK
jgi:uncharacterized membrane protein YwzB